MNITNNTSEQDALIAERTEILARLTEINSVLNGDDLIAPTPKQTPIVIFPE